MNAAQHDSGREPGPSGVSAEELDDLIRAENQHDKLRQFQPGLGRGWEPAWFPWWVPYPFDLLLALLYMPVWVLEAVYGIGKSIANGSRAGNIKLGLAILTMALLCVAATAVSVFVAGPADLGYEWGLILALIVGAPGLWFLCGGILGSAQWGLVTSLALTSLLGYTLAELLT